MKEPPNKLQHVRTNFVIKPVRENELDTNSGYSGYSVEASTNIDSVGCSNLFRENFPAQGTSSLNPLISKYSTTNASLTCFEKDSLELLQESWNADIVTANKSIAALTENIIESCKRIAQHYCNIEEKQNLLIASKALVSPIRQLPTELLNIIFWMCFDYTDFKIRHNTAPLVLCHVCRLWRDIVINQPSFWDCPGFNINFKDHGRSPVNLQNLMQMVTRNAGTMDLALELWDDIQHGSASHRSCNELLESFTPTFSRCTTLDLVVTTPLWYNTLAYAEVSESAFVEIENLHILISCQDIGYLELEEPVTLFWQCPKLTYLELNLSHWFGICNIKVPRHQILEFDLSFVISQTTDNVSNFVYWWKEFLAFCKKLNSTSVTFLPKESDGAIFFDRTFGIPRDVELYELDAFTIYNGVSGNVDVIFDVLNFYNLDDFTFEGIHPCRIIFRETNETTPIVHPYLHWEKLNEMLSISSRLSCLTLLRVSIEDKWVRPLLGSLPSHMYFIEIYNLKLSSSGEWYDDDSEIIRALLDNTDDKDAAFVPHLGHMTLWYPRSTGIEPLEVMGKEKPPGSKIYEELANKRSKLHRTTCLANEHKNHRYFILTLNFLRGHHDEGMMRTIVQNINAISSDIEADWDILDTYEWEDEISKERRSLMYQ